MTDFVSRIFNVQCYHILEDISIHESSNILYIELMRPVTEVSKGNDTSD